MNTDISRTQTILSLPFRPLGGQPPFEPDGLDRFLSDTRIATMSYIRKGGRSNQTLSGTTAGTDMAIEHSSLRDRDVRESFTVGWETGTKNLDEFLSAGGG